MFNSTPKSKLIALYHGTIQIQLKLLKFSLNLLCDKFYSKGEAETTVDTDPTRERENTVAFFPGIVGFDAFLRRVARARRNWNPRVLVFLTMDPRRFLGATFPFLSRSLDGPLLSDLSDKISSKENTSSPSRDQSRVVLVRHAPLGTVKEICNRVFENSNLWIQKQV